MLWICKKERRWNFYGVLSSLFYIALHINNSSGGPVLIKSSCLFLYMIQSLCENSCHMRVSQRVIYGFPISSEFDQR